MRPFPAIPIFLCATLALRLISIFATGFCDDEAYVVVISRSPALSYFDHPPLHQWLLEAWTAFFGEGRAARLPFLGCLAITTAALFGLARRLFSTSAAWWTIFAFNASFYFLLCPDGYIMPDPPLFVCLALGVWAVAEVIYGPPGRETALWLAAGLALGLAGLSKYSAVFAPLGLAGFFLTSARGRRWLADPRPYLGAALGALCLAPALIWNGEHHWVSFAFQSGRAARRLTLTFGALVDVLGAIGAQVAAMTPWIGLPLVAGLVRGFRRDADSPERFLLWLAAPPLALFALLPFLGERPISHWFNSGWLFAFPLAGAWLADRTPRFLARFFALCAGLAVVAFALYVGALLLGPLPIPGVRDPTRNMFDWPAAPLRAAYADAGAEFALVDNWRVGGRVGVALGPKIPVCAMGVDPRGFAFACDATRKLGRNALIVRLRNVRQDNEASAFFASVEPIEDLPVGRRGVAEFALFLLRGVDLERAPPLPYGP